MGGWAELDHPLPIPILNSYLYLSSYSLTRPDGSECESDAVCHTTSQTHISWSMRAAVYIHLPLLILPHPTRRL